MRPYEHNKTILRGKKFKWGTREGAYLHRSARLMKYALNSQRISQLASILYLFLLSGALFLLYPTKTWNRLEPNNGNEWTSTVGHLVQCLFCGFFAIINSDLSVWLAQVKTTISTMVVSQLFLTCSSLSINGLFCHLVQEQLKGPKKACKALLGDSFTSPTNTNGIFINKPSNVASASSSVASSITPECLKCHSAHQRGRLNFYLYLLWNHLKNLLNQMSLSRWDWDRIWQKEESAD